MRIVAILLVSGAVLFPWGSDIRMKNVVSAQEEETPTIADDDPSGASEEETPDSADSPITEEVQKDVVKAVDEALDEAGLGRVNRDPAAGSAKIDQAPATAEVQKNPAEPSNALGVVQEFVGKASAKASAKGFWDPNYGDPPPKPVQSSSAFSGPEPVPNSKIKIPPWLQRTSEMAQDLWKLKLLRDAFFR